VLKYTATPVADRCIDDRRARLALERLGLGDLQAQMQEKGSCNVPILDWLMEDQSLWSRLLGELDMYRHHTRNMPDGSDKRGWLRNCLYSQLQQAVRMDPLYYSLYVCLRADHLT